MKLGAVLALGIAMVGGAGALAWLVHPHAGEGGEAGAPELELAAPLPVRVAETAELPIAPTSPSPVPALPAPMGADTAWIGRNNEASRLLEAGELDRALELYRTCREARPDEDVVRRNLAEALLRVARRDYEEQRLAPAIAALDEVLALAPDRPDAPVLQDVLERWRRELEAEAEHWTESSDVFVLSYDTRREDLLRHSQVVLGFLEGVYEELRGWFGVDPVRDADPRRPFRVVLYDRAAFDHVTGLGDWAGGVFDGTIRVSIENLDVDRPSWERVLRHEFVHAYVHAVGGAGVPGWLNEGLAQRLAEPGGADAAVLAARRRLGAALAEGHELRPLEELRGSLASWSDPEAIALAYAESLVVVDHLARHYGDALLLRLIRETGAGADPAAVFQDATGVEFAFVPLDVADEL